MHRFVFILLFIIVLPTWKLSAQNSKIDNHRLFKSKQNYTVDAIHQDSSGNLWLGTSEGLVRYDGLEYYYYPTDSMADKAVSAINVDSEGKIWVGHPNGKITFIKNKKIEKWEPEEGLGEQKITSIFKDSKNMMWFATAGEGVYRLKGKRLTNLNTDDGLADNFTYCISETSDGKIWFGTDAGLSAYDQQSKTFEVFSNDNGLPDNIVKSIDFDANNNLWIGMEDGGVCFFDTKTKQFFPLEGWNFGTVNNLLISEENNIWVSVKKNGTVNIRLINGKPIYRHFLTDNGLINNDIKTIFKDRENNIWMGASNGISLYTGDLFSTIPATFHPAFVQIFSFLQDNENCYWLCSQNGLYRITKDIYSNLLIERIFESSKDANIQYVSLYKDEDGFVWVGTFNKGVFRFNPKDQTYKNFTTKDGLANDNVISISGKNRKIWFSTLGGGVSMLNIDQQWQFSTFNTSNGLPADYVYSSFTDYKNRTWFGLDGGNIAWYENGKLSSYHTENQSSAIYGFVEDANKNLYAYTALSGIHLLTTKSCTKVLFNKELIDESIVSVAIDKSNLMHIVTHEGIQCFNLTTKKWINTYSVPDEVAFEKPNLNAIYTDSDGALWIGTLEGLIRYNPHYQKLSLSPLVFISSINLFYNELPAGKQLFSYNENHLSFNFKGIWFTASQNIYYKYMLEGFDINWSAVTQTPSATYSNLPAGEYVFKVMVSNNTENWDSRNIASYSFTIKPPFWKKWWFISLVITILVGSSIFIVRWRIAILILQKKNLELEVQKRTAVISNQNQELKTQHDIIKQKNQSITDSINYASRIQQAALPPNKEFEALNREYFILYKPKDIVSGDFYWISRKENKVIVAVADCTGHGVPGAFMSMLGISILNEITGNNPNFTAAEILNHLRAHVKNSLRQTEGTNQSKDGMDIALCILDTSTLDAQFAGAYNPLFVIRNNELIITKGDRMPIGIHLNEKADFTNHVCKFEKGDMIYLFSDGYVDQTGGDTKRKYLIVNFKTLLLSIHKKDLNEQKQILEDTLKEWKGNNEQVDDILVVGIQI